MLSFPNENTTGVRTHYTLGRELGSGAFSVVYEGTHNVVSSKHAIKVVNKEETNAREMFQELMVMSQLVHVNIVHYAEIFDEHDGYYVVMELITGGELFDRIIELRRYSEVDASHVMKQAFLGMLHMHSKNLVHRDIKPENLLLSSKSADATVKIADFGFSKALKSDTDLYETLGTPPYMAPEIVILRNEDEDHPGYGRPVDVWALGICLYILLSGIHPYQIEDEDKMLDNIENGVWPGWKGSNWALISSQAKELITGMMNPNAKKRWTIQQCLDSDWIVSYCGVMEATPLEGVQESIKAYQAKKKFKGAIRSVVATQNLQRLIAAAAKPQAAAPVAAPVAVPAPKKELDWKTLKISVLEGRNLAPKDPNGRSDPYVTVWCGASKPVKTKTKYKTLNPQWENETFTLPATTCAGKALEIEVWDYDVIPPDEFMGRVLIAVDSLETGKVHKTWYTLERVAGDSKKKGVVRGEILLEIQKQ